MRVLVTGGAGYIGSHTVVELIDKGFVPVIIDDFRNSNQQMLERLESLVKTPLIHKQMACQDEKALDELFEEYKSTIAGGKLYIYKCFYYRIYIYTTCSIG